MLVTLLVNNFSQIVFIFFFFPVGPTKPLLGNKFQEKMTSPTLVSRLSHAYVYIHIYRELICIHMYTYIYLEATRKGLQQKIMLVSQHLHPYNLTQNYKEPAAADMNDFTNGGLRNQSIQRRGDDGDRDDDGGGNCCDRVWTSDGGRWIPVDWNLGFCRSTRQRRI